MRSFSVCKDDLFVVVGRLFVRSLERKGERERDREREREREKEAVDG